MRSVPLDFNKTQKYLGNRVPMAEPPEHITSEEIWERNLPWKLNLFYFSKRPHLRAGQTSYGGLNTLRREAWLSSCCMVRQ